MGPLDDLRMLVVAPHPDDDVLGCAGTLALAASAGAAVRVLYATDGAASHVGSVAFPPARLRAVREAEALAGLAALGLPPDAARFLRRPDGALSSNPTEAVRLSTLVRAAIVDFVPTVVYSPWIRDVHPDHVATSLAVRSELAAFESRATLYEYRIWGRPIGLADEPTVRAEKCVDVSHVLVAKRAAIAAHRSQLGGLVLDATRSFTLPEDLLERARRSVETFYEIARSAWT